MYCLNISAQTSFTIGYLNYRITSDSTVNVARRSDVAPIGNLIIPESVDYKGTQYSVTIIREDAFINCTGLTSVTIPNSVTSIGRSAFYGCTGLTSVTIPNSVTSIGGYAFTGCTSLISVTIPNSVTNIGYGSFVDCHSLTEINVDENNTAYSSIDGVLFNKSQTELIRTPQRKQGSYTIPKSVTSIGGYAFSSCTSLISVTIPNSVTSIGGFAFQNCTSLTSIDLPNSVTSIEGCAFQSCTGLTSINIPNSVDSIGPYAFSDCTSLTSVTIPNSVTSIRPGAFSGCDVLTEINVDENNVVYYSIDGVVFNKSQTELVLCPGGKQGVYTIPNSVASIGGSAFYGCSRLTSVTIPNSVTSIGSSAFSRCIGLTDIYCHIEEPLTISYYVFYYVAKTTCTLHVPIGSKEKYKAADVWKDFLNIVEDLPTGIVSIDNSQLAIDNGVWHTLNGVRLNGKPTKAGVYIVNGKKVVIK